MNDTSLLYIETPHTAHRVERIDAVLERRMKEFLLARQQRLRREGEL